MLDLIGTGANVILLQEIPFPWTMAKARKSANDYNCFYTKRWGALGLNQEIS